MLKDPRFLNRTFAAESASSYLQDYSARLKEVLDTVDPKALDAACQLLMSTRLEGGRVFVAGNGGSAAISEHLSCDWQKGVHVHGKSGVKVHCLTSNTSLLTAIANDYGYDKSFVFQLELAELETRDIVVLISSSGNSENVMQALRFAKEKGCKIVGLSGFSGGKLKSECDISLHVPVENYGVVEDAHQVLMHVMAQFHDLTYRQRN